MFCGENSLCGNEIIPQVVNVAIIPIISNIILRPNPVEQNKTLNISIYVFETEQYK